MENYIIILLVVFIIDYILLLSLKNIFRLSSSKKYLLFLQGLNFIAFFIYWFLRLRTIEFIMLKILSYFIICLLVVDSYKFLNIIKIFTTKLLLMFSYYGFYIFISKLLKSIIFEICGINISFFAESLTFFAFLCYVFAIFHLIKLLSKKKILKSFLRRVSFFAFGKHIEIIGLIDTGNILYDTKTKKPVIILKSEVLKKYLPKNIYINITKGDYSKLNAIHYLKAVSIGNNAQDIPIIKVSKAIICDEGKIKFIDPVIGIVNHKFENSNMYDCLLHRDFV